MVCRLDGNKATTIIAYHFPATVFLSAAFISSMMLLAIKKAAPLPKPTRAAIVAKGLVEQDPAGATEIKQISGDLFAFLVLQGAERQNVNQMHRFFRYCAFTRATRVLRCPFWHIRPSPDTQHRQRAAPLLKPGSQSIGHHRP